VLMAEELTEILSAPSLRIARKSSTVRIPPPTVKGINTHSATFLTISTTVARLSEEAVMSRQTSSSAPASAYAFAISTGSPASFRSTNFTPLTTLPAFTSRQGMILFVNITAILLFLSLQLHKISQYLNAHIAALLRVELAGEHIVLLDRRMDMRAV